MIGGTEEVRVTEQPTRSDLAMTLVLLILLLVAVLLLANLVGAIHVFG